jgi:hypothetical protein
MQNSILKNEAPPLPQGWTPDRIKKYFSAMKRVEEICRQQAQKRQKEVSDVIIRTTR